MLTEAQLRDHLERHLERGERVAWAAVPDAATHGRRRRGLWVFAGFWLSFIAVWTFMATKSGSWFPVAFSIPFWVAGFFLASLPFRARRAAQSTLYAVTDARALVLMVGKQTRLRSFYPGDLRDLTVVERRDGLGDLIVTHARSEDSGRASDNGFFGIREPFEVQRLVAKLARRPG